MKKAELLGPLDRNTTKLVLDRLSPQDQWRLATSSGSLYRLFGQESQKSLVYSFSVIPEGALEHPIFKKYPPNYVALIKFLRIRARHPNFIAGEFPFFDFEDVSSLVAIMGNEMALRELIGNDPKRKDVNGKCALDYLAFCGHTKILVNLIRDFYPDFGPEDAPSLHYYAALGGSEEVVFMLVDEYGFDINNSGEKRGWRQAVTLLHPTLWGKHTALLRRLLELKIDLHKTYPVEDGLTICAAEMGLWDWYEEFLLLETNDERAAFNDNRFGLLEAAACSNRRDKLLELNTKRVGNASGIGEYGEHYEEPESQIPGEYVGHAAIRSGQIEMLDWCIEQGWIDINGVFSSSRRPVKQEDKHPALFVAAIHGQLKMFDHLVEKYGLDPHTLFKEETVLNAMIMTTTWSNYQYIAQKYFADINFFSKEGDRPPVADAIQAGNLYNAQQYLKSYCNEEFIIDYGDELISLAEECEHHIIAKWLRHKLASLKPAEDQSHLLEEAGANSNPFGM